MASSQPSITLRPFTLADAADFLRYASDTAVTRYLRWGPITTLPAAIAHLETTFIPHPWRRSITLDDVSVGYVSIRRGESPDDDACRARIGYALARDHWGKGIMTAALRIAAEKAFEEMEGLVRLEALVEAENLGSVRVLEKVGFKREGVLRKYGICDGVVRDFCIYSLLSTDQISK
ncbi:hypothetical protein Droror1_Dr00006808 [Drosera rotundifolia]